MTFDWSDRLFLLQPIHMNSQTLTLKGCTEQHQNELEKEWNYQWNEWKRIFQLSNGHRQIMYSSSCVAGIAVLGTLSKLINSSPSNKPWRLTYHLCEGQNIRGAWWKYYVLIHKNLWPMCIPPFLIRNHSFDCIIWYSISVHGSFQNRTGNFVGENMPRYPHDCIKGGSSCSVHVFSILSPHASCVTNVPGDMQRHAYINKWDKRVI